MENLANMLYKRTVKHFNIIWIRLLYKSELFFHMNSEESFSKTVVGMESLEAFMKDI